MTQHTLAPAARPDRAAALAAAARRVLAAVAVTGCLCGSACAATSGSTPTAPAPSSSAQSAPAEVAVAVTIADGKVTPNGQKLDVRVGQTITVAVVSDIDEEIHAHTGGDGYELEVKAGTPATGSFTIAAPGSYEVEAHGLEKVIVVLPPLPPPRRRTMLVPLHGIGSRHDLPLPFGFVVAGASLALVLSFVVLVAAWRQPRFAALGGRPLPRLTRLVDNGGFRATVRIGVLACFGWAALALTAGKDLLTNPVFGFVYVWLWVGLVPLSLLLGTFWRLANPIRTLHRALSAIARVDPDQGLTGLPARIGVWPAAFGVFAFSWLELVQPERATLPVLRLWVLAWLVAMIVGAVVFGQRWIGAADPFEAYASTIAQPAPLRRAGEGLRLVNPLAGLTHWQPPSGTVALVAALLGGTAFDSFTNTTWWLRTVQDSEVAPAVWATGTLLAMIAVVAVTFSAAAAWMARYGGLPWYVYPRAMAGSVVPIVVGYAVAHYATLLVIEGQRTAIGWSDPLGRGWNVFGSARMGVSTSLVDQPTVIALVQLTAIVVGHLVGIVAAHELAVRLLPTRAALRGQLPMLLVMVGYTCTGLVLLFSP